MSLMMIEHSGKILPISVKDLLNKVLGDWLSRFLSMPVSIQWQQVGINMWVMDNEATLNKPHLTEDQYTTMGSDEGIAILLMN